MPEAVGEADDNQTEAASPPKRGPIRLLALGALLLVAAVVAVVLGTRDSSAPAGRAAAAFSLPSVRGGETISLASRDGRPAVVNFFASWCAPCKRELPHFASASRRLDGEVAFIGIAHQDDAELAAAMLREFEIDYPAGNDPEGEVARKYLLRGMPSTAFVAADGSLVGVAAGELDAEELDGWIQRTVAA
ncbi:MAG TPA: TlpA disulfide reductase family protein [Acidimicrobiales bacterium]|nr:TlpA disulfide reductase family protein [Acidimicrobiales bacterium]